MTETLTEAAAERTARAAFGWDSLLPGQAEAIASVVGGRDTLVIFPTGAGKSAVYQIAGLQLGGVTVVISPLLALQRDQIESIDAAPDAPAAIAISSRTTAAGRRRAWAAIEGGHPVYAFLAPEQLARDDVLARLTAADVRLLVVDEAHCVSAWGHDFRPDYARIGDAARALGRPPILGLTATASAPVRDEIVERLGMTDPHVEVRGVDRPEIHLAVRRHEDEADKRRAVLEQVAAETGPTLLYVATRAETERYAAEIAERGRRAAAYHGGMAMHRRDAVHEAWLSGGTDVVVATSAFGMGVDKPDVRMVVHADVTESLDAYVQEIGRAARDGDPAHAVLHYRPEDFALRSFFASGRTPAEDVQAVWSALSGRTGPARAKAVAEEAGLSVRRATRILNSIVTAGLARAGSTGFSATAAVDPAQAIDAVHADEEARRRIRESRMAVMRGYAETTGCRRRPLLEYFGVPAAPSCGACDRCDARDAAEAADATEGAAGSAPGDDAPVRAEDAVAHRDWGRGTVVSVEADRMTVFFEDRGYTVLALETLETGVVSISPA